MCPYQIGLAVWSTCNRFIATSWGGSVAVLDSATLQRLHTLEFPRGLSTYPRNLVFSPDSRILTCFSDHYAEQSVISWDLQTGSLLGVIRPESDIMEYRNVVKTAITYSADGKMVGVCQAYFYGPIITTYIAIFDIASGVSKQSYSINGGEIMFENNIWTHGESLQFVTAGVATITIWKVGFNSGATPTEVGTLPMPDGISKEIPVQVLIDPFRLAWVSKEHGVRVWDARNSKYLLDCTDAQFYGGMSFSSDGCFFACSTTGSKTYLWKESSPHGYILREILVSSNENPLTALSQTGESIVTLSGQRAIQLWRTKRSTTPTSSTLTQAPQITERFVLDFSSDERFAVFAMRGGDSVTVFNLKFGGVQLTIDTGMKVYDLKVTGNAVGVIGLDKVVTWNLPARDFVPDAGMNLGGTSTGTVEPHPEISYLIGGAMSSDFRHVAFINHSTLEVYSTTAGDLLGRSWSKLSALTPWFSPDGCDVWCANRDGRADVFRIGGEQNMLEHLEHRIDPENPPEGYPWGSSRYRITEDWWLLGPGGERLLMLPPSWRSDAIRRIWKGDFLALLHSGLSEPIILQLNVKA